VSIQFQLTNGEYAIVLIMTALVTAAMVMAVVIMAVLPQSQRMNPESSPIEKTAWTTLIRVPL